MLDIAFGMKQVAAEAVENPIVAMMAGMLENKRTEMNEDEFLSALAHFAMAISAQAVSGTVMLTLDQNEQLELEKTINELMAISEDTSGIE